MRKLVPLVFISGIVFVGASCSLFVDLDSLDSGDSGASDASDEFCDCVDTGQSDSNGGGDAGADGATIDAGINPCLGEAGTAGPRMIQADGYCIDATEVTVGQYLAFFDVDAGVTQPVECAWNNSFAPSTDQRDDNRCTSANIDPSTRAQHPISCVDWCDAWSYCEWAGKRLCGAIGGGAVPFGSTDTGSQWFLACASTQGDKFPDDSNDGGDCQLNQSGTAPVDSLGCNGSYPGLSDMVGNVEEWTDSCDTAGETPDGGGTSFDHCHELGDEFENFSGGAGCTAIDFDNRRETWAGIGFRCCSK